MKKVVILVFVLFILFKVFSCKEDPKITISTPNSGIRLKANSVLVKGKAEPEDMILTVKSVGGDFRKVITLNDGSFEVELPLPDTSNFFDFSLLKDTTDIVPMPITEESLSIYRELSAQEALTKQREEKDLIAQDLAEERRWNKSKAGRIQKKHPDWSREDCKRLAEGSIWVGMNYEMLKYKRGLPNSANPSNYGNGTSWQWCWHDWTPSCFYDNNDDGLIDSYN